MNRIQLTAAQLDEAFTPKKNLSQRENTSCIHELPANETTDMPTMNAPESNLARAMRAARDQYVYVAPMLGELLEERARFDLLCECGDCGTKGHTVPHPYDEEVKCVRCFGHGVNAWTAEEAREARGLALELGAMDKFHASVMRSVAARLIPASQVSEVMAIAIGLAL